MMLTVDRSDWRARWNTSNADDADVDPHLPYLVFYARPDAEAAATSFVDEGIYALTMSAIGSGAAIADTSGVKSMQTTGVAASRWQQAGSDFSQAEMRFGDKPFTWACKFILDALPDGNKVLFGKIVDGQTDVLSTDAEYAFVITATSIIWYGGRRGASASTVTLLLPDAWATGHEYTFHMYCASPSGLHFDSGLGRYGDVYMTLDGVPLRNSATPLENTVNWGSLAPFYPDNQSKPFVIGGWNYASGAQAINGRVREFKMYNGVGFAPG